LFCGASGFDEARFPAASPAATNTTAASEGAATHLLNVKCRPPRFIVKKVYHAGNYRHASAVYTPRQLRRVEVSS
jgi:hypothetical protein